MIDANKRAQIGYLEDLCQKEKDRADKAEALLAVATSTKPELLASNKLADIIAGWLPDGASVDCFWTEFESAGLRVELNAPAPETPAPTLREQFEHVITALNYDGNDTDSLTVGEIRRALP